MWAIYDCFPIGSIVYTYVHKYYWDTYNLYIWLRKLWGYRPINGCDVKECVIECRKNSS